jgi:glycosyltransferase involved in cell wall biosynthesis
MQGIISEPSGPEGEAMTRHTGQLDVPPSSRPAGTETRPSARGDRPQSRLCDLSVVIPLKNEKGNVEPLYKELTEVLSTKSYDYEIIFVDDGSKDGTYDVLKRVVEGDSRVTLIRLRRNFGQTPALAAGFNHSRGRVIIPMDGDLQNDPHDIPMLLDTLYGPEPYDIVSGWRRDRKDRWLNRRLPSQTANWLIRKVTGVDIHDFGCTLKAYRREVIEDVDLYSELHRFLPALAVWNGAKITERVVNHRPRIAGKTKYGLRRSAKVLLDLVTVKFLGTYRSKPLYFFGKLALVTGVLAVISLGVAINRNVLVPLASLLAFFSVQCVLFGVVSELLVRIYHAGRDDRTYRIREIHHPAEEHPNGADPPDLENRA